MAWASSLIIDQSLCLEIYLQFKSEVKPTNPQHYLLADDFDERSKDLSMRRSSWTIASSISKLLMEGSFQEFCAGLSLSEDETNSAILELLEHHLIYENRIPEPEPMHPVKPVCELLGGTFSTLAIGIWGNDNLVDQTTQVKDSPTAARMRLGDFQGVEESPSIIRSWIWEPSKRTDSAQSLQNEVQSTRKIPKVGKAARSIPLVKSAPPQKANGKRYKLQPIISQIEKLSRGGVEGSVLVYQVFLKVPPELLRREGIESLNLVDANTEFTGQELCQAIIRATTEITGYNLKITGYNG